MNRPRQIPAVIQALHDILQVETEISVSHSAGRSLTDPLATVARLSRARDVLTDAISAARAVLVDGAP